MFVLVARDRSAASTVRKWAETYNLVSHAVPADKLADAYRVADEMDAWREAHGGGKIPD